MALPRAGACVDGAGSLLGGGGGRDLRELGEATVEPGRELQRGDEVQASRLVAEPLGAGEGRGGLPGLQERDARLLGLLHRLALRLTLTGLELPRLGEPAVEAGRLGGELGLQLGLAVLEALLPGLERGEGLGVGVGPHPLDLHRHRLQVGIHRVETIARLHLGGALLQRDELELEDRGVGHGGGHEALVGGDALPEGSHLRLLELGELGHLGGDVGLLDLDLGLGAGLAAAGEGEAGDAETEEEGKGTEHGDSRRV